jgi:hypothetical protein
MFTLSSVDPWGRSLHEYSRMFVLSEADLSARILGCGDGPASFNAEVTRQGGHVVSCDPLYQFDAAQIRQRVDETYLTVMEQTRRNADEFVWDTIRSLDELGALRMRAMNAFLDDYPAGKAEGRYVDAGLPKLPFGDGAFGLALCSHFLFLYSAQLDEAFHVASLRELCRVAGEVRVFPLTALGAVPSPHVEPVVAALRTEGFDAVIERVPYEFQRGGNRMLRVR